MFGKNISRIWNMIEVYFFRLFIVGLIIVLLLFPIAILINFIISLTLTLTAWIWIPLFLIVRLIFSLLIYDLDSED